MRAVIFKIPSRGFCEGTITQAGGGVNAMADLDFGLKRLKDWRIDRLRIANSLSTVDREPSIANFIDK